MGGVYMYGVSIENKRKGDDVLGLVAKKLHTWSPHPLLHSRVIEFDAQLKFLIPAAC